MLNVPFYFPTLHHAIAKWCFFLPLPCSFPEMTFQRLTFQIVCTVKLYPWIPYPNLLRSLFRMLTIMVDLLFLSVILDEGKPIASFYLYFLLYILKFMLAIVTYHICLSHYYSEFPPSICVVMYQHKLCILLVKIFDVPYNWHCSVQNTFKSLLSFLFDSGQHRNVALFQFLWFISILCNWFPALVPWCQRKYSLWCQTSVIHWDVVCG